MNSQIQFVGMVANTPPTHFNTFDLLTSYGQAVYPFFLSYGHPGLTVGVLPRSAMEFTMETPT